MLRVVVILLLVLCAQWHLAAGQSFPQQNVDDVNYSLDDVSFTRDWFPTEEVEGLYIDVAHISSMIQIGDCLLFGCADGVNNTSNPLISSNPLIYCAQNEGSEWRWSTLTLNFETVSKPGDLGKKYSFLGTDSEGTPFLATARYVTDNGSEFKPYILALDIEGDEATVTRIYELTLPTNGQYVNRQVEVYGSLNQGDFTAASIVWDGNKPDYLEDAQTKRSHLRVWSFESETLATKKMYNNFMTTFASIQMLSESKLLIDDRGMIVYDGYTIFTSEGEENYIPDLPSIYDISGVSPVKESEIDVPAGVYDCGARIFEISGHPFIFYTSGYQGLSRSDDSMGPTAYTIASLEKGSAGSYDLSTAKPLWTITEDYPTTGSIENYDRNGDSNEQAVTRSSAVKNGNEADLYFSTNGISMTHLRLKSDDSTSSVTLEFIPEDNATIESYNLSGLPTDPNAPGLHIIRTSSGRSLKILRH